MIHRIAGRSFFIDDRHEKFVGIDLSVERLDSISSRLWLCGRAKPAQPLHKQRMMGRQFMITEKADMHLLYYHDTLYIKPLPAYLLVREVWEEWLNSNSENHASACGFLLSYCWLISSPSDFIIATEAHLIPPLTWERWRQLVKEFVASTDCDDMKLIKRYHYGELLLRAVAFVHRRPAIWRRGPSFDALGVITLFTALLSPKDSYYGKHLSMSNDLQRNLPWIVVGLLLTILIVVALQLGASNDTQNVRISAASAT